MLKEPQKVGTLTSLWKSFEEYLHTMKNACYRDKDNEMCMCLFQLKYNNAETLGPCLLIFYPENTNPISLPVTSVSFILFFVSSLCPFLASMSLLSLSTRIINIIVGIERNVCEVQLREMNGRNDLVLKGKFSGAHTV